MNTAALNRISFFHGIAIENGQRTDAEFSPLNPQPGEMFTRPGNYAYTGTPLPWSSAFPLHSSRRNWSRRRLPGERNFGLFRSARQSMSPVEEFMHLYHILVMLFNDSQADVDAFIVGQDSAVPQTQHHFKAPGVKETVYTRLRNELAHNRLGVNLDNTKAEMANRLVSRSRLQSRQSSSNLRDWSGVFRRPHPLSLRMKEIP